MPENETANTPGAAIGSMIVIIVLLAGAIYFSVDYFKPTDNLTGTSTPNMASSTPIASSTPSSTN